MIHKDVCFHSLQKLEQQLREQILILENDNKRLNLKSRGIGERMEESMELTCFTANWVATELKRGEDILTLVHTQAI